MNKSTVWAVVPAAGKGLRMGAETPKQYLLLAGKPVVYHTLEVLVAHPQIAGVVIVIAADDAYWSSCESSMQTKLHVATGGTERCHSVLAGLDKLSGIANDDDWVLVHDAARPCLRAGDIHYLIEELRSSTTGGILAFPVGDTLKRCNAANEIQGTVDRTQLWRAMTPQMFRIGTLRMAINATLEKGVFVTDEAQAIEAIGGTPRVVKGHADNIKITHSSDLALAEIFLRGQGRV
tara:strand:- start:3995 stop:4699 length:705 start_codon:yes stop_codon:yes gene_type:complete